MLHSAPADGWPLYLHSMENVMQGILKKKAALCNSTPTQQTTNDGTEVLVFKKK
jgi:hypothetical protein